MKTFCSPVFLPLLLLLMFAVLLCISCFLLRLDVVICFGHDFVLTSEHLLPKESKIRCTYCDALSRRSMAKGLMVLHVKQRL